MARRRILAPEFFTDAKLLRLSPLHRLFFAGLWCLADRVGVFRDEPEDLALRILPRDNVSGEALLADLAAAGFVARYTGPDGHRYAWIRNWTRYQAPRNERESGYPYPSKQDCEIRPVMHAGVPSTHASANVVQIRAAVGGGGPVLPDAPKLNPPESGPGSTNTLSGGGGGGGGEQKPSASGARGAQILAPLVLTSEEQPSRRRKARPKPEPAEPPGPTQAALVEAFAEEYQRATGSRYAAGVSDYVLAAGLLKGGATPEEVRARALRCFHPGLSEYHRAGDFREFATKYNKISAARLNGSTHNVATRAELDEDAVKYGKGEL